MGFIITFENKNTMISTPKEELTTRLQKVQQVIIEQQADACIITSSVNQFYLNDFIFDGYLYILPESDPFLFIKRPIGIKGHRVAYIRKPEQIPDMLNHYNLPPPRRLLLEADTLSYTSVIRLQTALSMPKIANISQKLREMRAIKSDFEINQIRESAKIHAEVYSQIPSIYQQGMTDIDFQIELEYIMRKAGSLGIFRSFGENMDIYMGSVLAGDNAQIPSPYDYALGGGGINPLLPLGTNGTLLKEGITLMVDMAGNYRPYMDDMTRTFAIGKVPKIAYQTHQVSIDIHNEIWETAKPGTLCSDLYLLAEKKVRENRLESYFMGTVQQAKFIGHGVGLEINEPPVLTSRSKETLQPGMAIALEPKFVLPNIGAVGIENTYIVNKNGLEKITLFEEALIAL